MGKSVGRRGGVGRSFEGRRVVVYLRISSDPEDERRGVSRQTEDAVSAVVDGGGVVVWKAVENDTSAFKKRRVRVPDGAGGDRWAWRVIRPKWEKALTMIRAGEADCLLVVDLDRLTRDPRDLEDAIELVEHYRAAVLDVTGALDLTTDHGVFLARMIVAHANLSSRDTSRRIRRAKRADAQAGKPNTGARSFGYAVDGVTVLDGEAELIGAACERLLAGGSAYSIVADWNARGLVTARGKAWSVNTLRTVLTNPRLAGLRSCTRHEQDPETQRVRVSWDVVRRADGTEVAGLWDAIVPRGTWEAVCALYAGRANGDGGRNTRKHLLSGLLRCAECGGPMAGAPRKDRPFLYRCTGKARGWCGKVSRRGDLLDAYVTAAALEKWETEVAQLRVAPGGAGEGLWPRTAELDRAERKLGEAHAQWKTDRLSGAAYFEIRQDLEADLARLRRELALWSAERARAGVPADRVDVRAVWDLPVAEGGWTLAQKRDFLSRQLVAVEVHRHPADPATGARGRRWDTRLVVPLWRDNTAGRPEEHAAKSGSTDQVAVAA